MVPRWTGNRPYMRKSWANPVISVLCTKEPTRGHLIKYNNNNNSIRYSFGLTHLCKWDDIFKPTSFWWLCKCWFSVRSVESLHPYWLFEKNAVEDFHWLYFAILCLPFRHGFKSQWQWFGDAIICSGDSVINIDVWRCLSDESGVKPNPQILKRSHRISQSCFHVIVIESIWYFDQNWKQNRIRQCNSSESTSNTKWR